MRVLVTGARGFVGRHLCADLARAGHEARPLDADAGGDPACHVADIRDPDALNAAVREARPDACVHLAGIAFVPVGWKEPRRMLDVNLLGSVALLDAFRAHAPAARVLLVSTAQVYGTAPRARPIAEDDAPEPDSPYAVAKLAADWMGRLYASRHGLAVLSARPCNHIGPGQSPDFVVSSFAAQLAAMKSGRAPARMRVGNLDSAREFLDVRDVVRGYRLLLERGTPGEIYNLSSGRLVRIREILDALCRLAGVRPEIEVAPELFRPTDAHPVLSHEKARAHVGWQPEIPLEASLRDILAAARAAG